jgi:hypothetical protein
LTAFEFDQAIRAGVFSSEDMPTHNVRVHPSSKELAEHRSYSLSDSTCPVVTAADKIRLKPSFEKKYHLP